MSVRDYKLLYAGSRTKKPLSYTEKLEASMISAKGKVLEGDFTEKAINSLLYDILGKPGVSAGKAQRNITNSAGTGSDGTMTSAYTSAQSDTQDTTSTGKVGGSSSFDPIAAGIGLLRDVLGYFYADKSAQTAYKRQNEYYDNHLSMPAKVEEYQDAGLNPMALTGAGVGATSAPAVQQADAPSGSGLTEVLGTLLNYKLGLKQLAVQEKGIDSEIAFRAEQQIYQQKVNEWFEINQIASLDKMQAETSDALQRVKTGEANEALARAGVTQTEAEAALITQQALQKMWENSPEWRNVQLQLGRAQASAAYASAAHAYEDIKNLAAQRDNIAADTCLKYAQTDIGRQQLTNLGLEEKQIQFAIDHQKGDLIWSRVSAVTQGLKDVGIAAASIAGAASGFGAVAAPLIKTTEKFDQWGHPLGKTVQTTGTPQGWSVTQGF